MESHIKKNQKNKFMPTIMTICIMIAIVSILAIARGSLRIDGLESIPITSNNLKLLENDGLDDTEENVLTLLSELINDSSNKGKDNNTIYVNNLKEYLSNSEEILNSNKALEIEDLIKGRNKIMYLEKQTDVNKMSFDGREVTIYIYKRIFELCGLKLLVGSGNDIEQIVDQSGAIYYQKNNSIEQSGFQAEALVITLLSILTLFYICIIITKKNQLFVRSGRYDGLDEKKYA